MLWIWIYAFSESSSWPNKFLKKETGRNKVALKTYWQCCGSGIRIRIFYIPDHGSASKNLSILTQKIVSNLLEIWSGLFIPDPDPGSWFFYLSRIPNPRIQRSKRHRIRIRNTAYWFLDHLEGLACSRRCFSHQKEYPAHRKIFFLMVLFWWAIVAFLRTITQLNVDTTRMWNAHENIFVLLKRLRRIFSQEF